MRLFESIQLTLSNCSRSVDFFGRTTCHVFYSVLVMYVLKVKIKLFEFRLSKKVKIHVFKKLFAKE